MKRVWVVDDRIPVQEIYGPHPAPGRLDSDIVRDLLATVAADHWPEAAVRALCSAFCVGDFEAAFFTSPDAVRRELSLRGTPPHVVIYDWEGTGFGPQINVEVLNELLSSAFVYVQIYTHVSAMEIEAHIAGLRDLFGPRLLPTRTKTEVNPAQLRAEVEAAWANTIAGEMADTVRERADAAVEKTLIEISALPKGVIAAVAQGHVDILLDLVVAKARDELSPGVFDVLAKIADTPQMAESSETLRRFMSVWYYYFPKDDRVRSGDIVVTKEGHLRIVITPSCDLAVFPTKTSGCLSLARMQLMTHATFEALSKSGCTIKGIGWSIVADHPGAGDKVVILPNVPRDGQPRKKLEDCLVIAHARETVELDAAPKGWLTYKALESKGLSRVCSLGSPFADAVTARILAAAYSPGLPDLPKGEFDRLRKLFGT